MEHKLGAFFEAHGMPRMSGRLLGHLLVCQPPEQTFDELVAAMGASKSTVSVTTRLLVRLGFVERFSVRGERRDRYRVRDDAWTMMLRQDVEAARQLRMLAEDGLAGVTARSVRARLTAMRDFYIFLEDAYTPILKRWERR